MDLINVNEVEITTFVNPHLFWFVLKNNERGELLKNLNKQLLETCKPKNTSSDKFEVGEIVAGKINDNLYRAIIEDIETDYNGTISYLLWLIDFGTLRESTSIFKLPSSLRRTLPLSIQASLNHVVYLEQVIEYDSCGQVSSANKHVLKPTSRSRQKSIEHLQKAHSIKFKFDKKEDGIVFGDLLYIGEDKNQNSLTDVLIEDDILVFDENLFEDMADFINNYKENHLMVISKICNDEPYCLDPNMENQRKIQESCMNIVSKVLDEFNYSDLLSFEDEEGAEPLWLSNKSKNDMTSLDTSVSDNEISIKMKSKKEKLMEKLWQHKEKKRRSDLNENITSESTDFVISDNTSDLPKPKTSTSKIKKLLEKMKQRNVTKEKPVAGTMATNMNRKIVFTASGCERSFLPLNGMSKKNKARRPNYDSEESSSEPIKNFSRNKYHAHNKKTIETVSDHIKYVTKNKYNAHQDIEESSSDSVRNIPINECIAHKETGQKEVEMTESPLPSNSKADIDTEEEIETSEERSSPEECPPSTSNNVNTLKIKPHCSCKQCGIWTNEENIFIEKLPKHRKIDKVIGLNDQLLFRENSKIDSKINICSIDYASMSKIEKQAMQKLLVHSEIFVRPIHHITKMSFDRHIQQNLHRLNYREAKRIQSYAWPALLRNQHVFMINGPQTGKTLAYLPAMCTFILEKVDRYNSLLKVAGGPIIVILCANTQKCEEVYDLTKVILGHIKAKVSLVTYPLAHINTSHTDMLITTPYILFDLLKSKSINFKRLCHLILEDGDTILHKYQDLMKAIFDLAQSMLKNRVFTKALQLVVCAEHWNSHIKSLMMSLQQVPMICIGNYLEAALYGNLEFSMKFINSSCKHQELKLLLKESHRVNRSVIICKEDEIEEIHEILTLKGIDSIPMSASLSQEDMLHYERVWTEARGGSYSVLICSDFVLNAILSATCATTLIHYSLPKSWTKFLKRFSCLLENCNSPLNAKEPKIINKNVVLCDESCKEQMFRFFNFINSTDLKKQLPEKLQLFSETLKLTEEEQKLQKDIALCENLKLFGKCTKKQCSRRHLINSYSDVSNYLPKSGKIKFKIVDVVDVTIFSIRLLQYVDDENKVHEYEELTDITEDLTATLRLGRKTIHNPVIGHQYAFYNFDEQEGIYYRCEVLNSEDDCVKIKLIDKGTIISTLPSRLYRLPKEFDCTVRPRTIIDAYLANYVPPYDDDNFSAKAFHILKSLLDTHDYKNVIFSADVRLELNHTLWLKDVYEEIALSDKIIPGFQLSREILLKKLVDCDPNQLKNLYKLCNDADIVLPKYNKPKVNVSFKKEKVKLQWAHLEADKINEVTFASAFSPDEVFIRPNKFSDMLFTLQKEIQESVKKPNYPKLQEVNVGEVYLAKDPVSEEYCRVLVLKKESEKVLFFYLDFGDEGVMLLDELKYIQPILITKLPFQCVQCRLHGIKPFSEKWEEDATNVLYEYAHEPGTDIFRSLYVKVCIKENSASPSGTKYSIILKDGFGDKKLVINQLLIECGLVTSNEEEISDFEIPDTYNEHSDSNEELNNLAYICKQTDELDQQLQLREKEEKEYYPNFSELEVFQYGDSMDFSSQFFEKEDRISSRRDDLPAITAVPKVDYHTPEVYWWQTDKIIKLNIKLMDVKDYKLTLTKGRILNFKTVKDQKTYCLKMMFYEIIKTMQHTTAGQEIRVTLEKIKHLDWPRLILSKQKTRNIHYDIMQIPVEEEHRKILQLPKELDDNDDSDGPNEDDPMYTVVSDLDSDMDIELEHDSN